MKNFRALALSALLPLTACGGGHKPDGAQADTGAKPPPPFHCPQVAVLAQAQTLTLFLPDRQDVAARVSTAQVTGVSGSCKLKDDKKNVMVTVKTAFTADNGPANHNAALDLPWFAAIAAGNHIIQKVDYSQKLAFGGNESMASGTAKPFKIELPNIPSTSQTQILVGFEETPAQLAYAAAHPNAAP